MIDDFVRIRTELAHHTGPTHWLRQALIYDCLDSTNDFAKTLIRTGLKEIPTLVIADTQTAGRGRFHRSWHSPQGAGLWFSLIQCVSANAHWSGASLTAGVITARAIYDSTGIQAKLKWPNDVLISGKKCAGILIETVVLDQTLFVITGVGINVNQEQFPEDLSDMATSLYIESGQKIHRHSVLKQWIRLAENYEQISRDSILREWRAMTDMLGKKIIVEEMQSVFEAEALDIADDGGLVVKTGQAIRTVYAADIRIRIKN